MRAMSAERVDPPFVQPEREMLDSWLEFHRATLALKCEGLSDEQLRERSVPPSSMSLLGLVRHMAEVERNWFRRVLSSEDAPPFYYDEKNPDGDFDDVDTASVEEAFATWRAECDNARAVAARMQLDDEGTGRRHGQPISLRWVLVHMIEEYARHNGHADFLRERIDGTTGD
jgi:uncharacterized damage-inducible protein DinB